MAHVHPRCSSMQRCLAPTLVQEHEKGPNRGLRPPFEVGKRNSYAHQQCNSPETPLGGQAPYQNDPQTIGWERGGRLHALSDGAARQWVFVANTELVPTSMETGHMVP
uniref:Uncharacterized protein n=1 Tax=Eutreptiella gymnastica TaxID=73025 RepID=A0A7S4GEN7_9EUGL|mmetsp:Transcript_64758/g.108562  ORF Transcript_64758/g.108562 Transcript_64758/m.108562 type:complete len:108 (-) Transcript_64758:159-482(-)